MRMRLTSTRISSDVSKATDWSDSKLHMHFLCTARPDTSRCTLEICPQKVQYDASDRPSADSKICRIVAHAAAAGCTIRARMRARHQKNVLAMLRALLVLPPPSLPSASWLWLALFRQTPIERDWLARIDRPTDRRRKRSDGERDARKKMVRAFAEPPIVGNLTHSLCPAGGRPIKMRPIINDYRIFGSTYEVCKILNEPCAIPLLLLVQSRIFLQGI